jgi:hypothetical protein
MLCTLIHSVLCSALNANMTPSAYPAAKLVPRQRIALAIQTLTEDINRCNLAAANDVSRKYLYQQKDKAHEALQEAFAPSSAGEEVLFRIPVTSAWLCPSGKLA